MLDAVWAWMAIIYRMIVRHIYEDFNGVERVRQGFGGIVRGCGQLRVEIECC